MEEKYIVREVPPEQAEFSWYFDDDGLTEAGGDFCYNLFIISRERYGRYYGFNIETYKDIVSRIEDLADSFSYVPGEYFKSYKAAMEDARIRYSPQRCKALKDLLLDLNDASDPETVAEYLTITTGKQWDVASATGYRQGDYCEIVYCKQYHKEPIAYGEVWLGAAKEFCVIDLDEDGNELESVYGYIVADCQAWRDEDYKRLVCEWAGIPEEETRLEMVDGYTVSKSYSYRTA